MLESIATSLSIEFGASSFFIGHALPRVSVSQDSRFVVFSAGVQRPEASPRTLRQFAGAWLVFISILGAQQYFARGRHTLGIACIAAALGFGILGLVKPPAVRWLFVSLTTIEFPIGWVISQIMLAVMFYVVLTPIALVFRLIGRDVLQRKPAPGRSSFWLPKRMPADIRSYFRQY